MDRVDRSSQSSEGTVNEQVTSMQAVSAGLEESTQETYPARSKQGGFLEEVILFS